MNAQWKQRIVGFVVIVAVAAIFMPMLFHKANPLEPTRIAVKKIAEVAKPDLVFKGPSMLTARANQTTPTSQQQANANTVPQAQHNTVRAQQPSIAASVQPRVAQLQAAAASKKPIMAAQAPSTVKVVVARMAMPAKPSVAKTVTAITPKTSVAAVMAKTNPAPSATQQLILSRNSAVPQAWVIQVASFSNEDNAKRLISKLRGMGYDAYRRDTKNTSGQLLVRVFVGPEISKESLHATQKKLQSSLNLSGLIKRYTL